MSPPDDGSDERPKLHSIPFDDSEQRQGRRQTNLAWEEDEHRPRRHKRHHSATLSSHRRSASRDSIRSASIRAQANSQTLPIEFRTLSFSISTSQPVRDSNERARYPPTRSKEKKGKSTEPANDFSKADDKADEHTIDIET